MNLPNKLTLFRIILSPVFMIFILMPENNIITGLLCRITAASLFLIMSGSDWLDGKLARKYNLITDFGKLMDPLADKFMVIGAMIAITGSPYFEEIRFFAALVTSVIFFRELAVTSVRLVANNSEGNVIAANILGKLKTASQCACILTVLLEDLIITRIFNTPPYLFSYITMSAMLFLTVYSGFDYIKTYRKYINPRK